MSWHVAVISLVMKNLFTLISVRSSSPWSMEYQSPRRCWGNELFGQIPAHNRQLWCYQKSTFFSYFCHAMTKTCKYDLSKLHHVHVAHHRINCCIDSLESTRHMVNSTNVSSWPGVQNRNGQDRSGPKTRPDEREQSGSGTLKNMAEREVSWAVSRLNQPLTICSNLTVDWFR